MRKKTFVLILMVLAIATLFLITAGFTNKVLFAVSLVATFAGARAAGAKDLSAAKQGYWFSVLLLAIFVIICSIALYYLVFLEVFIGAADGFLAALVAKAMKK
jgi:hypothetical protein